MLNDVGCGPEMKMFGGTMMEHETRYHYADQWIEIVQKLWNEPGYFDYQSEFFNLTQAFAEPKPLNRPVLINAGGSPRGKRYCAQHCDVAFVILNQSDPETTRNQIQSYRDIARREFGRDIQIWCYSYCVQRDSLAEAQKYLDYYVNQLGDDVACDNITKEVGIQTGIFSPAEAQQFRFHFKAGWAGVPLVGTPEMIVDQFQTYADFGIDGICLSWLDYSSGLADFVAGVLPLMEQAGLREKFAPAG